MDFVAFESLTDNEHLPSPQPSLSLPLKPHVENLGLMSNLSNLKSLLKSKEQTKEPDTEDTHLAEMYANLSLKALGTSRSSEDNAEAATPGSSRTSALSKRLSRALNPSLSDSEIRELFGMLEAKNGDISSVVDPGIIGSVSRKNKRGEVEADLIKSHTAALADYEKIVRQLQTLGESVEKLDSLVSEVNRRLDTNQDSSQKISKDIKDLTTKQASYKLKKQLLVNFKNAFTLNEYEQHLLVSGDINAEFFAALTRAEDISDKCSILLALDDPQLGQSIMSKVSELTNQAVNRILTFCNRCLTNMYSMNNKARTETLHQCLEYLKKNPVRYAAVFNTYAESRSAVVLEEFAAQISGDRTNAPPSKDHRPVYYTSHDPVRFAADILAYVHSVVVDENELLDSLFQDESDGFKATKKKVMGQIFGALGRPVRSTIDQLISKETKLKIMYKIYTNLDLYLMMFEKLSFAEAFVEILNTLLQSTRSRIVTTVSNQLATVASSNQAQMDLSADLQPPEWIINFYGDILPIIDLMSSETILSLPEKENNEFLDLIVDKPISVFETHLGSVAKTLNKEEVLIFKQNFLDLVISKIMPLTYLDDKVLELNRRMYTITQDITRLHMDKLLQETELFDFYNVVNMICPLDDMFEVEFYEAIKENKLFNEEQVLKANDIMQSRLPTALLDVQNNLMRLNSPAIVSQVVSEVMVDFTQFYRCFTEIVEKYLAAGLLTWSPFEVATLLGVENEFHDLS